MKAYNIADEIDRQSHIVEEMCASYDKEVLPQLQCQVKAT
jgi:hypothetical protein